MSIVLDGSNGITTPMYNGSITANAVTPSVNMKNRIINGNMTIDQRNAGASVNFNTDGNFPVDRFKTYNTVGSGSTAQQSSTAPAGFTKSILFTVGTGASPSASSECRFFQVIEGFNTADLNFGTANAKTITVSFWVRSSITGTYALGLRNDAGNRSYVATYTISSANTWEQKSITIAGDTTGTWVGATNGTGIMLRFDLGSGSNSDTTAGAWQAGNYGRTSACVNWIATSGATFYITGVQLEVGSTATSFDYRPYGTELALCQRYYYRQTSVATSDIFGTALNDSTTLANGFVNFPVSMRAAPTALEQNGTASHYRVQITGNTINCSSVPSFNSATTWGSSVLFTVASGLTAGQASFLRSNNTSAYLGWSAEL